MGLRRGSGVLTLGWGLGEGVCWSSDSVNGSLGRGKGWGRSGAIGFSVFEMGTHTNSFHPLVISNNRLHLFA